MSGGSLDYLSLKIDDAIAEIEEALSVGCFSESTKERFREEIAILRRASIYAYRTEWLFSGDDDEESFNEKIKEDLKELEESK